MPARTTISSLCMLGPDIWPEVLASIRSYQTAVDQMFVATPKQQQDGTYARWNGGTYVLPSAWKPAIKEVAPSATFLEYEFEPLKPGQSTMMHIDAPARTILSGKLPAGIVLDLDADEIVSDAQQLRAELSSWDKTKHNHVQFEALNMRHVLKRVGDKAIIAFPGVPSNQGCWIGYTKDEGEVRHNCSRWVPNREPFPVHTVIYNLGLCWSQEVVRSKLERSQEYLGGDAKGLFAWWNSLTIDNARGLVDPWPHGDGRWWHKLDVIEWSEIISKCNSST